MTDNRTIISYRIPEVAPAVCGVGVVGGVVGLVLSVIQGGPVWFFLLYLGGSSWIAYNYLVRAAHAVAVTDRTLFWISYVRTVEVDMHDVVGISAASGGTVGLIECRHGRKLRVPIMQGYQPFIEEVARHFPQLDIEGGRYSRFVDGVQLFRPKREANTDLPPEHERSSD